MDDEAEEEKSGSFSASREDDSSGAMTENDL